jgi:hypothetical protein
MSATTPDSRLAALSLAALGVVYGDIGTSPLYAIKEVFGGAHHPVPITPDNVLGILSLIFWSLMIVVSLKYVTFITRADNRGEGGIMALMALALRPTAPGSTRRRMIVLLGLFGAALFYGDGVITPAISVLSAVEGLEVATPAFAPYVLPISLIILVALFASAASRHRHHGQFLRTDHGAVVPDHWDPGQSSASPSLPRCCAHSDPGTPSFLCGPPAARVLLPGRGRAGVDRRRGAVCRHGALRAAADPVGLVCPGAAGVAAELFRAGGAVAARSAKHRQPVLPAGTGLAALSDGGAGDRWRR